jgi:hypothetical protein
MFGAATARAAQNTVCVACWCTLLQIERTHIPRPRDGDTHSKFGFVHFRERASAMRAVEDEEKPSLNGALLNVRPTGLP